MAMTGTIFQYSDSVKLDRTKQETWTSENAILEISSLDSLGNRSRVLRVKISNPLQLTGMHYRPMQRVRLLDDWGIITFLGRVVSLEPDPLENVLIVTCRDYLDDISDRTVEAVETNGLYNGATPSNIIDTILQGETYYKEYLTNAAYKKAAAGQERTLARRIAIETSPYREYVERTYSQKGGFQSLSSGITGDYLYRGVKTGLEAVSEIADSDPQQDLMAFYYHNTPTNPISGHYIADPIRYPRSYWTDLTRECYDGLTSSVIINGWHNSNTPTNCDILYFGSNSKFDGLRYTFLQAGTTTYSTTLNTVQWQYWNGVAWTNFTPTADAKFNQDTLDSVTAKKALYGTTYWNVNNLTDWSKRDLASTPDMPTSGDATLSWPAPWATTGTTLPDDVNSTTLSKMDHGDERKGTTRYWVRVYNKSAITGDPGYLATVSLYTQPKIFHDFRCADPQYFDEVWKYVHNVSGHGWAAPQGRESYGGVWTSLNMSGGNAGTGDRLLWDANDGTTNFLGATTDTWYFGSNYPFNGITFHAAQDSVPDYSNVDIVWQWYSNFFNTDSQGAESWQTISGLTISGNTVANPTVITTERHHLITGDSVTISGSNSTPTINGTHTVTVLSATTFSIAVNVTSAGTAGHVVCNSNITATQALGNVGDAGWKEDGEAPDTVSNFYIDVRWDNEKATYSLTNDIPVGEWDNMNIMDQYPYPDKASLNLAGPQKDSDWKHLNGNADDVLLVKSISAANPTVLTSGESDSQSTPELARYHNMRTGDTVQIQASRSTPSIDGTHVITKINDTTFSIPINVTTGWANPTNGTGPAAKVNVITKAPNSNYLYWARCFIKSGTPTTVATLRDVKTSNVGTFRYFDRGSEPWVTNNSTSVNGPIATTAIPYCYRYDTSASAGSKFTDYSAEIQSATSGATDLRITGNTVANPTVVTTDGPTFTISSNTVADPTVVTTSAAHGLTTGDDVVITNSNSTPSLNGTQTATVLSTTTFSIDLNVTTAGSAGTVVPIVPHGLTTGHKVVISGSNSTPSLNGTHTVTVLSTTTFSVPVNVTGAGTAGTVVPEHVYAMDAGQVGDAVYFGSDEPFSILRLNLAETLNGSYSGLNAITWEFYRGGSTDNWTTITHWDESFNLIQNSTGLHDIYFQMPQEWRVVQPGIKESNSTDQSFGKSAYYVRARLTATSGSAGGSAKIKQGFFGPNTWHPNLEVGTLSGVSPKRKADPLTYGLTLTERTVRAPQRMPVVTYEIKEHPIDFVNKVTVRGQAGSFGVAEDTASQDHYGIVKERTIDDSSLVNSIQCESRAQAILETLKPEISATFNDNYSIREAHIRIPSPPIYSFQNKPSIVRAGDLVNVNLPTAGIRNESWLVYSITSKETSTGWACDLILFADYTKVFEPGPADRRLLRDLVTRSRETANAVFQPLDKAVVGGIDFLPEGSGRTVGRDSYAPIGEELDIYVTGGSSKGNYTNEFRWTKQLYSNHNTKTTLSTDLLRISHDGITPDQTGVSQGGGGLTLIGRDKRIVGGTPDFHPGTDEATLYLRNSATASEGSGLYLAHRDIFNSGSTYDEWGTDTPKINAEVFTGFTGFVTGADLSNGMFNIVLPNLDSAPLIFTSICGHEAKSGHYAGNWVNALCTVYRLTTSGGKYTNAQMRVIRFPASGTYTGAGYNTITAITPGNPCTITTSGNFSDRRMVWIGETNSYPVVDGLYYLENKSGSGPYTYTLDGINSTSTTSLFPQAVDAGNGGNPGKIYSIANTRSFTSNDPWADSDYDTDNQNIGIMYMVVFNSGKNTSGMNTHFSQNHLSHP